MAFGKIQFGEIIAVGLDVGTFRHREAHVGEDRGEFVDHLADRMHAAGFIRSLPDRQRDIDGFGIQPRIERRAFKRFPALGDSSGDAVLEIVDRRAFGAALVRRHAAERLQQRGHRAAFAQRCDPHRFQRCFVAGRGDTAEDFLLQLRQVGHGNYERRRICLWSWPGLSRPSR
jgi:hypothetical protein